MPNRKFKPSLRRTILGAAIALAGATGVVAPAGASTGIDGTSNTLMVAAGAVRLDVARHQVVVSAPATGPFAAGRRLDTVEVHTPRATFILSDILVSSLAGGDHRSEALSLNFTKVEFMDYTDDSCMGAARACLIEEEGLYPPAR
jgi:hypothetical protein